MFSTIYICWKVLVPLQLILNLIDTVNTLINLDLVHRLMLMLVLLLLLLLFLLGTVWMYLNLSPKVHQHTSLAAIHTQETPKGESEESDMDNVCVHVLVSWWLRLNWKIDALSLSLSADDLTNNHTQQTHAHTRQYHSPDLKICLNQRVTFTLVSNTTITIYRNEINFTFTSVCHTSYYSMVGLLGA